MVFLCPALHCLRQQHSSLFTSDTDMMQSFPGQKDHMQVVSCMFNCLRCDQVSLTHVIRLVGWLKGVVTFFFFSPFPPRPCCGGCRPPSQHSQLWRWACPDRSRPSTSATCPAACCNSFPYHSASCLSCPSCWEMGQLSSRCIYPQIAGRALPQVAG